jgi:Na+/H+-dicarboxylate symporter
MKEFFKHYGQTVILLLSIIIGAIIGLIWKEGATVLSPFGDIFLNLMFVIIVPLVFLTISTSIARIKQPKRLGKIMGSIVLVIVITSIIAVVVGLLSTFFVKLVNVEDGKAILESLESNSEEVAEEETEELNILERTVSAITVSDFTGLLSKNNLIALVIFSILFGCAIKMSGEKGKPVQDFLESATTVIMNLLKIVMYYAPIGLGCYFAALVGSFGANIALGYAKTFIIYLVVSVLYYFIMYTVYAFIAGKKKGIKMFWKNAVPPTVTALATCSSAASIPVNMKAASNMGISSDIAETSIPLGTNLHKDGSIIGSVFKVMFLVCLFGTNIATFGGAMQILLVSLVATLLVTAVPIGGGTISEMMILTMMGYPVTALPILTIIATIIDCPATVLNVVGNTSSAMLVSRIVDGKDCLKEEK